MATVNICLRAQRCPAMKMVRVPKHMACTGRLRSWACGLMQKGDTEGLSAAGGLQLLEGQLQKQWSQTLLDSARQ